MGNVPSVKKKTKARVKKVKYKSESSKNLMVEKNIYITRGTKTSKPHLV